MFYCKKYYLLTYKHFKGMTIPNLFVFCEKKIDERIAEIYLIVYPEAINIPTNAICLYPAENSVSGRVVRDLL